ncbi:hypothetical protein CRG98_020975 [Punica granatum]|uniref:Neprosin PEP catalytic domain-containing protein n=1 Tax=Punica granatum TaxID=22663 RepID=A0A2I0JQS7_PUNGR|nr:hypothetical protein CRG98_020975 [Punica granatum]
MATCKRRREVVVGIFLLITAIVIDPVPARRDLTLSGKSNDVEFARAPRGTVKTVQSGGGDVVDCVDIHKQPAFDHPLLKNHTIQMKPSFLEEGESHLQGLPAELEEWGVDCPEETVPIIRKTSENGPNVKDYVPSFLVDDVKSSHNKSFSILADFRQGHEYAVVQTNGKGTFRGSQAHHNVWNPSTEIGEISVSQIWISAGSGENLNTVEAGWIVLGSSPVTRFFTYWTSDAYKSTGCYNLDCPGFVLANNNFAPGFVFQSISTYGGKQFSVDIQIKQNWWLRVYNKNMGYWPGSIFNSLTGGGSAVTWGGEIYNSQKSGHHTATQMGSGHFPRDGYFTKSAYIRNLAFIQDNGPMRSVPKEALVSSVTKRQCYDLVMGPSGIHFGTHFYFGGSGLSAQCP